MPTRFEERTCVSWCGADNFVNYGVVIGRGDDGTVDIVPVRELLPGIHCYHEGLNYKRDHDNVRLEDAPPPFAFLCIRDGAEKCFAVANTGAPISFYPDELDGLTVTDGGIMVSERDFDTIFDHPWPEQPQKEFVPDRKAPELAREPVNNKYRQTGSAFASLMASISDGDDGPEKDAGPDFW